MCTACSLNCGLARLWSLMISGRIGVKLIKMCFQVVCPDHDRTGAAFRPGSTTPKGKTTPAFYVGLAASSLHFRAISWFMYVVTDITNLKDAPSGKKSGTLKKMHCLRPCCCCREHSSVLPPTPCEELYGHEPSPQLHCSVPSKPRGLSAPRPPCPPALHHLCMFKLSSYFSVLLLTPSFLSSIFLPSP